MKFQSYILISIAIGTFFGTMFHMLGGGWISSLIYIDALMLFAILHERRMEE